MAIGEFITPNTVPSFNKPQFILSGFGLALLKPKFYKVGEETVIDEKLEPFVKKNVFGLPVFGGIGFKEGAYINKYGTRIAYDSLLLECCLIEVGNQRQIVKTNVQGRDNSVKQFISNGDDSIVIKGVLAGGGQLVYPDTDMRKLQAITHAEEAVSIVCPFLQDYFKINSLVVTYASFPQKEGNPTVQLFELQCISDSPVQLKIKDA